MKVAVSLAVATTAALFAGVAGADVVFTRSQLYIPTGIASSASQFSPTLNTLGLVEAGRNISQLGMISGGRLPRSKIVLPELDQVFTSTIVPDNPSRVLVTCDINPHTTFLEPGLALYSTEQAKPLWIRPTTNLSYDSQDRFAITRYGSDTDIDFVVSRSGALLKYRTSDLDNRLWFLPGSGQTRAVAAIRATATTPARVAQLTSEKLRIVDSASGTLLWEKPLFNAHELAVADLTGDGEPEVVVGGIFSGTYAFSLATQSLLWSRTNQGYGAIAVADYDGNGRSEVLVQSSVALTWLNGLTGDPSGLSAALPLGINASSRLVLADVAGNNQKEVIAVVSGGDVPGTYVYTLTLQAQLLREPVHYIAVGSPYRYGDVDGDGQQEVLKLARSYVSGGGVDSSVVLVGNIANGYEEWSGWSGPQPSTPRAHADFYADLDLAQLDADAAREIVLATHDWPNLMMLVSFDGASHVLQRREVVAMPNSIEISGVRAVPAAAAGGVDDLLVTANRTNHTGVNLARLDGTTWQPRWTLELPDSYPVIRQLHVRQMDDDAGLEAVVATSDRFWIVDLQSGQVQREVPTAVHALAIQELPAGRRVLTFDRYTATLSSFDAGSGGLVETFSLRTEFAAMVVDGTDPDRLFVATDTRRIHALRLSTAREEGRSDYAVTMSRFFQNDSRVDLQTQGSRLLLGDDYGAWALDFTTVADPPIFADGLERQVFSRLPPPAP